MSSISLWLPEPRDTIFLASVYTAQENNKNLLNIIRYTLFNQTEINETYKENYNCSGIVEKVLNQALNIEFGDPKDSHPLKVSKVLKEQENIIELKHEEKEFKESQLTESPSQLRARM